jgi:hypothetical protein
VTARKALLHGEAYLSHRRPTPTLTLRAGEIARRLLNTPSKKRGTKSDGGQASATSESPRPAKTHSGKDQ